MSRCRRPPTRTHASTAPPNCRTQWRRPPAPSRTNSTRSSPASRLRRSRGRWRTGRAVRSDVAGPVPTLHARGGRRTPAQPVR
ncbi:hypothetical protein ACFFX0_09910 [Citricoccus parietis]|uniref:Uncharacterized protein n=1 Tax=Citricoccus parietis TaxID=592307 RepID=A0ABV5FXV3_9MICC